MGPIQKQIEGLGLLHDAALLQINWKPQEKSLEFAIEDLYANFAGRAEYPGERSGSILFNDIQQVNWDIAFEGKHLMIYELSIAEFSAKNYRITVLFSPAGRINLTCGEVRFPNLPIPTANRT